MTPQGTGKDLQAKAVWNREEGNSWKSSQGVPSMKQQKPITPHWSENEIDSMVLEGSEDAGGGCRADLESHQPEKLWKSEQYELL